MCGINGIVLAGRWRRVERDVLERMRDCISHRGPDDSGLLLDGEVGLGHRRLSIVDVAAGHQPMTNEDGTLHVVYNGEIYNHADSRPWLEARGHTYRTHCDTETILHLYEEKGARLRRSTCAACSPSPSGTRRARELFIARDRLGVKPLYYVHTADGSLFFASEIKALLEARAVSPELNYAALPDYLANHGTSGDETLFAGVRRLPPGHTLLWRDGHIDIQKYWDVTYARDEEAEGHGKSDEDYVAEWSELFRESVRLRLMADVPLGMFLSGGIDSSAIAAVMSRLVDEPIKTFSVAFAEREANELAYARLVAEAFKTDHHEVVVSPRGVLRGTARNSSGTRTSRWRTLRAWRSTSSRGSPREHVKVVLTGEGSDEMLAGYERYYKTVLQPRARPALSQVDARRRCVAPWPRASRRCAPRLARSVTSSRARSSAWRRTSRASTSTTSPSSPRGMQRALLTPEARERAGGSLDPYADMRRYFESAEADSLLDRMLYADTKTYLHELLMKQDQMSMAASIESRVPFLDHKLVEFTARLPQRMKLARARRRSTSCGAR